MSNWPILLYLFLLNIDLVSLRGDYKTIDLLRTRESCKEYIISKSYRQEVYIQAEGEVYTFGKREFFPVILQYITRKAEEYILTVQIPLQIS